MTGGCPENRPGIAARAAQRHDGPPPAQHSVARFPGGGQTNNKKQAPKERGSCNANHARVTHVPHKARDGATPASVRKIQHTQRQVHPKHKYPRLRTAFRRWTLLDSCTRICATSACAACLSPRAAASATSAGLRPRRARAACCRINTHKHTYNLTSRHKSQKKAKRWRGERGEGRGSHMRTAMKRAQSTHLRSTKLS